MPPAPAASFLRWVIAKPGNYSLSRIRDTPLMTVLRGDRGAGRAFVPRPNGGLFWRGLMLAVTLVACNEKLPASSPAPTTTVPKGPGIFITPRDGTSNVALDTLLNVTIASGRLESAVLTAKEPDGTWTQQAGGDGHDTWWQRRIPLGQASTYSLVVRAVDTLGNHTTKTSTFTTLTATAPLTPVIAPADGETVGVGMPIVLRLNAPIADRAAFERRLQVVATPPVDGAWHWFSDHEVHWRPQAYWPTKTQVTVTASLAGYDVGNGVWGVSNPTIHFTVGPAQISTVDVNTHQMTVTSDGQPVRTLPVSTGRDKYPTKGGIHVVSEKAQTVTMDSATVGIPRNSPDGYYEKVFWNVRISNSGEFVHAAPWSVRSQGHANVSHGCVNVAPEAAQWFYGFSHRGDVVNVVGSPATLEPTNGWGDWNVPWPQWANGAQAISAAPDITQTGPSR
jgi:lipoprotein-anchoring transpeptidase ErfK/SrfK